MRAPCPAHLNLLELITLTIFDEEEVISIPFSMEEYIK
jgi:hypothetical protein